MSGDPGAMVRDIARPARRGALLEAADEVRKEARYQEELRLRERGRSDPMCSRRYIIDRLLILEDVLRDRAESSDV